MATKWKNGKQIIGFLSFALGVSLLLSSLLPIVGSLFSVSGRQQLKNALQRDFQETGTFRTYLSGMMNSFIAMGAGGPISGSYYDYSCYEDIPYLIESTAIAEAIITQEQWDISTAEGSWLQPTEEDKARWKKEAEHWNNILQDDRNLLYYIECNGKMLYSNTGGSASFPQDGYGFLLSFDGSQCSATKNGVTVDLYGDGYFKDDGEHWELPGYANFQAGETAKDVVVHIAVADTPALYIKGDYTSAWAERQYNRYYALEKSWYETRQSLFFNGVIQVGVGSICLLIWWIFRKEKALADRSIAHFTGKIWFEIKLLLLLFVLFFLFFPLTEEMRYLVREAAFTISLEDSGYCNIPWFLGSYVNEIIHHPTGILALFWGAYIFINDLRYGDRPWNNGIFGMLRARNLKLPIQKRLSRRFGFLGLALLLLGGELITFLILQTVRAYLPRWAIWNLFLVPLLLASVIFFLALRTQRSLAVDLGRLADQISAVRNGELAAVPLPIASDLGEMSQDVADIQQGMAKAVEEQTRSERMKVELVTNVSHDIKTPLTSIISYAELLKQEELQPPAGEYVEILIQKAERLRSMVLDVFDVSKAASGNLPVKLEALDLSKLLQQTLADMAEYIESAPVTVKPALPNSPVVVTADGQRLYRVFQNLLQNALKYALEGSRVYLSLGVEEDKAVVSIKNTSKTELPGDVDFTERFVRGDVSRSDGGSGLGLAIADSFTRACGGELKVEPIADLFVVTVSFPLAEETENYFIAEDR